MEVTIRPQRISDAEHSWRMRKDKDIWKYAICESPYSPLSLESENNFYSEYMYVRPDRGSTDIIKSEFQGILPCSGITGIDILVNPIHFSDAESIFTIKKEQWIKE